MSATGTAREEHQSMEFSVTKSALLNELSTTQGVVERKTTIPILSNLLVEAKGSQLTITATDLELSIRTSCEAKIKGRRGDYSGEKAAGAGALAARRRNQSQAPRESLGGNRQRPKEVQARWDGEGKLSSASHHAPHTRQNPRSDH